jgi:hypothetical protein
MRGDSQRITAVTANATQNAGNTHPKMNHHIAGRISQT